MESSSEREMPADPTTPYSSGKSEQGNASPDDFASLISRDRLLEISDGDEEVLKQFFDIFFEDSKQDLEKLAVAIQGKDMEQIRRLAHKCSGSSGSLGINGVSVPLKEMEIQVTQGNSSNVDELFKTARSNWEKCRVLAQRKPLL